MKEITRGGAKFVDGKEEKFDSIILATGYKSNVPSWLKVIIIINFVSFSCWNIVNSINEVALSAFCHFMIEWLYAMHWVWVNARAKSSPQYLPECSCCLNMIFDRVDSLLNDICPFIVSLSLFDVSQQYLQKKVWPYIKLGFHDNHNFCVTYKIISSFLYILSLKLIDDSTIALITFEHGTIANCYKRKTVAPILSCNGS